MRTPAHSGYLSPPLIFLGPGTQNYLGEAQGTEAWGDPQPETPLANAMHDPWQRPLSSIPELYSDGVIEGMVTMTLKDSSHPSAQGTLIWGEKFYVCCP